MAALFYTLTETCKLLDIDPNVYMLEAVRRAKANREDGLTPMAWKIECAAREASA